MKNVANTGSIVALAAAGLFACANNTPNGQPASQASASTEMVKCAGINDCKGHGECGGQGHDCAGHNECKGQGWVKTTAQACSEEGGEVI